MLILCEMYLFDMQNGNYCDFFVWLLADFILTLHLNTYII